MRRLTNIIRRSRPPANNQVPDGGSPSAAPEPAGRLSFDDGTSVVTALPLYTLEDDASILTLTEPPAYTFPSDPQTVPLDPRTQPDSLRETWLQAMQRPSLYVRAFVMNGGRLPGPDEMARFLDPTATYAYRVGMYFGSRYYDSDDTLLALVQEGMAEQDHVLAVLSCCTSPHLSLPVASMKLKSLIDLDPDMYLRCLTVAVTARTDLASSRHEAGAIRALHYLSIERGSRNTVAFVEAFVQSFGYCQPPAFLTVDFVLVWLHGCGAIPTLRGEAMMACEGQQLARAYRSVRCVQALAELLGGREVLGDLDGDHSYQNWQALLCWRPDVERLSQWEFGCLSPLQRRKLFRLVALDGPDTATRQQASLGKSEPACYGVIRLETQTTARLEQMLELLSRSEKIGTNAVELFIRVFVDNLAEDEAFVYFDQALGTLGADDARFQMCIDVLQPHGNGLDVCLQVMKLTEALPLLSATRIPSLMGGLAARVEDLMSLAQDEFVAQLEIGPADYIGTCILDFGCVILDASCLRERLSPTFLDMVRRFPQRDIADAIFQRLENAVVDKSGRFSALRSHLVSCLGGRTDRGGSVDVADIQNEAVFWKTCQDSDRRELARALSELSLLDYRTYTTCLVAVTYEKSMFIRELRLELIEGNRARACANLITYLAGRRKQGQLTADCWTLLLVAFIEEHGAMLVRRGSPLKSIEEWLGFIQGLLQVASPAVVQSGLRPHGDGITMQRLVWWQTLSNHKEALKQIKSLVNGFDDVSWMYLTRNESAVTALLQHAQAGLTMSTSVRLIISLLDPDGSNLAHIADLLNSLANLSRHGMEIVETALWRASHTAGPSSSWTKPALTASIMTWLDSSLLEPADKDALRAVAGQLDIRLSETAGSSDQLLRLLNFHYSDVLQKAAKLETKRWRLKHANAQQHAALAQRLGIRDAAGKASGAGIPLELQDTVEELEPNEYEMSFPLTGLSDLQRQARGVPAGARLLVVRARLRGAMGFCIHYASIDEPDDDVHAYWQTKSAEPDQKICGVQLSLFGYYLGRNIHRLLKASPPLGKLYGSIEQWAAKAPATCSVCGAPMGVKLWKAGSCSRSCSALLRSAPPEVRLHNLLVDPLSIDLLLVGVYTAALAAATIELLPGCPVARARVPAVVDALPAMATLAKGGRLDLGLLRGPLGPEQEKLLSWLCLSFRGFMRSAPAGYVIPSMPGSQQFLVVNAHREREQAFERHLGASGAGSGPVFHGTEAERLFLILSTGIKNLSGMPGYMSTGAVLGPGVYCGDDQGESWRYARPLGRTWAGSALQPQMRLMLGCELAKYPTVNTPTHVVRDETRVLVRYVLLLQPDYRPPPRRHVAPAMSTAFAKLRSGRAN